MVESCTYKSGPSMVPLGTGNAASYSLPSIDPWIPYVLNWMTLGGKYDHGMRVCPYHELVSIDVLALYSSNKPSYERSNGVYVSVSHRHLHVCTHNVHYKYDRCIIM